MVGGGGPLGALVPCTPVYSGQFPEHLFWLLTWQVMFSKITLLLGLRHQGVLKGSEKLCRAPSFITMKCSVSILTRALPGGLADKSPPW